MRIRVFFLLLAIGLTSWWTEAIAQPTRISADFFKSGDRRIAVAHFTPAAGVAVRRHAVVLYGAGGIILDGPRMRRVAQALVEDGYDVSLIHYFNRTGTLFGRDKNMQQNFEAWLDTVRQGIARIRSGDARHRSVYVYGYSLGAFLAVAAASDNGGVAAVAEHAGGIWNNQKKRIGRMPPVLMIHGQIDQRVPLAQYARPLRAELRRKKGGATTHFYAHEGHVFSKSALVQVQREVPQFFDSIPNRGLGELPSTTGPAKK